MDDRDQAELSFESGERLSFEDKLPVGNVWASISERIRRTVSLAQDVDEGTQFCHRDTKRASVLPEHRCFHELRPRHDPVSTRLEPEDGPVGLLAVHATVQPVVQRRLRDTQEAGRFSLGVHLAIENAHNSHGPSVSTLMISMSRTAEDGSRRCVSATGGAGGRN